MNESEALAWAQNELLRLVAIPSRSGDEVRVVNHLEQLATNLGLPVHVEPVWGCGSNWQPMVGAAPHIVPGLGSQDDEGSVIACLLAFVLAREAAVDLANLSVGLGFCVDEEEGGSGPLQMAAQVSPKYVVAMEGTSLRIATIARMTRWLAKGHIQ